MGNRLGDLLASPESEEKARTAFKLMDKNADNMLDRKEWKEFGVMLLKRDEQLKEHAPASAPLAAVDTEAIEVFVEQMFRIADSNHDGLVSYLSLTFPFAFFVLILAQSFEEFFEYVKTRKLTTSSSNLTTPSTRERKESTHTPSKIPARPSSPTQSTLTPTPGQRTLSPEASPSTLGDRASRMAKAKRPSVHNFRPSTVSNRSTMEELPPLSPEPVDKLSARDAPLSPHPSATAMGVDNLDVPLSARTVAAVNTYPTIEGLVWDEEIKVDPGVRPIPKAATLERLVEELTPTGESNLRFMHYFLITYRSFTNPSELVQLLIKRFRQSSSAHSMAEEQQKMILQRRVLRFVKKWVDEAFYDFNQSSLADLMTFLDSDVKGPYRAVFDSIYNSIKHQAEKNAVQLPSLSLSTPAPTSLAAASPSDKKHERYKSDGYGMVNNEISRAPPAGSDVKDALTGTKTRTSRTLSRSVTYDPSTSTAATKSRESGVHTSAPTTPTMKPMIVAPEADGGDTSKRSRASRHSRTFSPGKPILSSSIANGQIDWKKVDVKELAIQLTLADFASLRAVHYSELLFWLKAKLKPQAPNVASFIERFNKIGAWVATQIVTCPQIKHRVRIISMLIQLAKALEQLNNFNGVMAILGGLNSTAVHRLKFTFDSLSEEDKAVMASLANLMDNHSSFANYRKRWSESKGCRIPYLGVIIQDLLFVDEGSADVTTEGLVNFRKRRRMAAYLEELQHVQNYAYAQPQVPDLYEICLKLEPHLGEKEQYNESLIREPRQATLKDVL